MFLQPTSLQAQPGLIVVRLLVCQKEWVPADFDVKRLTLRCGTKTYRALPMKLRVEPWVPIHLAVEFPVQQLTETLTLHYTISFFQRQTFDLLHTPLHEPAVMVALEDECRRAWFERACELELAFLPARWRVGEGNLDEALRLLERYLHDVPDDVEARRALDRVRLKKELAWRLQCSDWVHVAQLNGRLSLLQPDWRGPEAPKGDALDLARRALAEGWFEVADDRLREAYRQGGQKAEAALLLARISGAWNRDPQQAAEWYVRHFECGGYYETAVYEAIEALDKLGPTASPLRARLLANLSERLVARPDDAQLADLVQRLAETQASQGVDVSEDFALLWACYEKAFEHQLAVERRVDRGLSGRLEKLHARLGNHEDWIRICRAMADLDPGRVWHREQLAQLLTRLGRFDAALSARMALWLTSPCDLTRTHELLAAAEAAGEKELALRTRWWFAWLQERPMEVDFVQDWATVPARLLLHSEIRPLAPLLLGWIPTNAPERDRLQRAVEMLLQPLPNEAWRQFEVAAKKCPLTAVMKTGLLVRPSADAASGNPLILAAQLSLDRFTLATAPSLSQGWFVLTEGKPSTQLFQPAAEGIEERCWCRRIEEAGRFILSRLWDAKPQPDLGLPADPLADVFEALCLHGMPDWGARNAWEEILHKHKRSRAEARQIEVAVLRFLRLETQSSFDLLDA